MLRDVTPHGLGPHSELNHGTGSTAQNEQSFRDLPLFSSRGVFGKGRMSFSPLSFSSGLSERLTPARMWQLAGLIAKSEHPQPSPALITPLLELVLIASWIDIFIVSVSRNPRALYHCVWSIYNADLDGGGVYLATT